MKKLLIVLTLLCTTSLVFGITDSTVTSIDSTVSELSNQVKNTTSIVTEVVDGIEKISGNVWVALEELAKVLKVPAQHIYSVIIKQQTVKAITELLRWCIIPLLVSLLSFHYTVKKWKFFSREEMRESAGFSIALGGIMILLPMCFLLFGCDWNMIITGLINPEFGALSDITEMVNTLTK